jgi:hypothetical protein
MPVFYYLSPDEAADVYLFLALYPPSELSVLDTVATRLRPLQDPGQSVQTGTIPRAPTGPNNAAAELPPPSRSSETQYVSLFAGLGFFAAILVAGGIGFTLWEFKRLSSKSESRALVAGGASMNPGVARHMVVAKQDPCRTFSGGRKLGRPEQLVTDEVGDLTRKNTRGGRRCHGACFD